MTRSRAQEQEVVSGEPFWLGKFLLGWRSYYGFSKVPTSLQELEKWIRRRLRCYLWKQWGRRGYRERS